MSLLHSSNRPGYGDVVRDASRVYNDWLADFINHDRKRLIGSAMIPMDDVAWAVAELARVAKAGFRTPMIHAAPPRGSPPYRDKTYDPFWASVEVISQLGASQVVWGSDFPHTISVGAETGATLTELFEGVGEADQKKLVAENAAALFRLVR